MKTTCWLLALAAIPAATPAESGHEVVQRYYEAIGGEKQIAAVDSIAVRGRYELGGISGTISLYFARPDKLLFRVDLEGLGTMAHGSDGETAWSIDPREGPRVLRGEETASIKKWVARGFSLLPDAGAFSSIGESRASEHDGIPCVRVPLTLAATGETYSDCFDPESGLLVGRSETVKTPAGEAEMLGWAGGYQRFGALLLATEWRHRVGNQSWSATYESIELDKVDPEVFALPAEIRELLADGRRSHPGL